MVFKANTLLCVVAFFNDSQLFCIGRNIHARVGEINTISVVCKWM